MKWYGLKTFNQSWNIYQYKKRRLNKRVRRLALPNSTKQILSWQNIGFYLPSFWNFILLNIKTNFRYKIIYLYNNLYFFKIILPSKFLKLKYHPQLQTLELQYNYNTPYLRLYLTHLKKIFYSFSKVYFLKIKFKGKGYYIYKNLRNTITPQFGHAHRLYFYSYFTAVKFLSKTTVFLFGLSKKDLLTTGLTIKTSKPINVFTGRGVRFSRQIIYRKVGKVSSYR